MSDAATGLPVRQMDLDFNFIQRNVRDLAKTAQFGHFTELEELHKLAYANLKDQMAPGKPLAVDPSLVLETYKTISGVIMSTIEVKRKAADTLLKARTLVDVPSITKDSDNDLIETRDAFDEDVTEASLSSGGSSTAGIYGGLVDSGDPEM